ncbi:MAG TPA: PEP-CTERM sorting domain-containing protein [Pyrinomonadaceae bacterium]|nr:PEP-CTERM sorting domain-containing protein [Pyrinomonadaceae bacterium]
MRKAKTWLVSLGVLVVCALAIGSARADVIRSGHLNDSFGNSEEHLLSLPSTSRALIVQLFAEDFEGNNGRHLGWANRLDFTNGRRLGFAEDFEGDEGNSGRHQGFSVASVNRRNKFGLFKGPDSTAGSPSAPTPNPEPAAIFLLGTGLAAAGAYARRRFKKSGR